MKTTKRIISIILSLAIAVSVAAVSLVTASAQASYHIISACDNIDDENWKVSYSNGQMSIDNYNKIQGDGSIYIDMPADGSITSDIFTMMTVLNFDAIDLNDWDYYEMCLYTEGEFKRDPVLQYNFVDTDVRSEDGFNCGLRLFTRNYNDPDNPSDEVGQFTDTFKQDGWIRFNESVENILLARQISGTSADNISKMRISWLYYSGGQYDEVDWGFDGLIMYNQDFLDERTAAEESFKGKIDAAVMPTAENLGTVGNDTLSLINDYNAMAKQYPNFMPENFQKYFDIRDAYYDTFKSEKVSAAQKLIASIGEINLDNIAEKTALVEQAEAAVNELDNLYGNNYELINKGFVANARTALEECTAAKNVADMISGLPAISGITLDAKPDIEAARKAYNALEDSPKGYITEETLSKLTAAEAKIYELEHPYTLGKVNDDDDITAADALMALQFSVGKIELTDLQQKAADVDLTDGVSAADALLILQYAVGKIDTFPRSAK